jgi:hypothetical protein
MAPEENESQKNPKILSYHACWIHGLNKQSNSLITAKIFQNVLFRKHPQPHLKPNEAASCEL